MAEGQADHIHAVMLPAITDPLVRLLADDCQVETLASLREKPRPSY